MMSSSKITKTTTHSEPVSSSRTYETRTTSSYSTDEEPAFRYRPTQSKRTTIIQRTAGGGPASYSQSRSMSRSMGYGGMGGSMPVGSYQTVTSTGVAAVKTSRDREKKDMQDLNERFASYIEKVRFLEAQNRKLADELNRLKEKWGKETSAIKAMYQAELDEARKLLDEAEKDKARLEIRVASLEEQLDELRAQLDDLKAARIQDRETIDRQNQQLSDYEAEINLLRRRIEQLENDHDRDKKEISRLQEALNRARIDLDTETLAHIDAENRRQTLEEELEFLKQVHEQEMKELAALAYRDTTAENREFWKNEMGNALREIQQTYDEKLDAMRGELETYYNLKIQEFRTGATRQNMETVHAKEETKRLRNELSNLRAKLGEKDALIAQLQSELESLRSQYEERIKELENENDELKAELAKMRAELEAILKELQDIMDTKLGLELEIAAYRKLLEGEENRTGLKQVVEQILQSQSERIVSEASSQAQTQYTIRQTEQTSGGGYGSLSGASAMGASSMGASSMGGSSSMMSSSMTSSSMTASSMGGQMGGGQMGGAQMGGAQMVGQLPIGIDDSSLRVSQVVKGEMSAKTTYQRSAKGPVSIMECAADGKYLTLENTSKRTEELGGWRITRVIDGNEFADFTLPKDYKLNGGSKSKIWARNAAPYQRSQYDIEANIQSFGVGGNIVTKLLSASGEEKASHVQKTLYS